MFEWYVITNFALSAIAALACFAAGDRLRWLGFALLVNFSLSTYFVLQGVGGWHLKALVGSLDLTVIALIVYAKRAFPMSRGLNVAMVALFCAILTHLFVHVLEPLGTPINNEGYYTVTNGAIALAAIGLIWSSVSIIGARYGLADRVASPYLHLDAWRLHVPRHKGASATWKT
jgi:hypothetical protein